MPGGKPFRENQAELFIRTLTDMLVDERAHRAFRLRQQVRGHSERTGRPAPQGSADPGAQRNRAE